MARQIVKTALSVVGRSYSESAATLTSPCAIRACPLANTNQKSSGRRSQIQSMPVHINTGIAQLKWMNFQSLVYPWPIVEVRC